MSDGQRSLSDDPYVADIIDPADNPGNVGDGDEYEATFGLEPDVVIEARLRTRVHLRHRPRPARRDGRQLPRDRVNQTWARAADHALLVARRVITLTDPRELLR